MTENRREHFKGGKGSRHTIFENLRARGVVMPMATSGDLYALTMLHLHPPQREVSLTSKSTDTRMVRASRVQLKLTLATSV